MKVICSKAGTCTKDAMCGAKKPHDDSSCEPCPFDRTVKCIVVAETEQEIIRKAVADYMRSEGCSCCQDVEAHDKHKAHLASLLDVPMYDDASGYDFYKFASDPL